MTLEGIAKVSDIVFKGIVATAVAVVTVYFTWQKNAGERITQCDAFFGKLIDAASDQKATDLARQSMQYRLNTYATLCGNLDDQQVQAIMNVMKSSPVEAPNSANAGRMAGWVALSRIPATKFSDTNFDNLNGHDDFSPGDQLKARWSVNLRQKNTPVAAGDNPIIGIIDAGTCVTVGEQVTGALNEWAKVAQSECH